MSKWQPIETAPKDGTWLIACWTGHRGWMAMVFWDQTRAKWCDVFQGYVAQPTHWMPLPPPPQENIDDPHMDLRPEDGLMIWDIPPPENNVLRAVNDALKTQIDGMIYNASKVAELRAALDCPVPTETLANLRGALRDGDELRLKDRLALSRVVRAFIDYRRAALTQENSNG